jgi:hypothetical protein
MQNLCGVNAMNGDEATHIDPSVVRHSSLDMLLIHGVNCVWISQIFSINYKNMQFVYFDNNIFLYSFLLSLLLIGIKWWKYLNVSISNQAMTEYELLKKMKSVADYFYIFLPYFLRNKPSENEIRQAILHTNSKDFIFNKNSYIFLKNIKISRPLLVNLVVLIFTIPMLMDRSSHHFYGDFLNSNWIIRSITHTMLLTLFSYAFLTVSFYFILTARSKLWV